MQGDGLAFLPLAGLFVTERTHRTQQCKKQILRYEKEMLNRQTNSIMTSFLQKSLSVGWFSYRLIGYRKQFGVGNRWQSNSGCMHHLMRHQTTLHFAIHWHCTYVLRLILKPNAQFDIHMSVHHEYISKLQPKSCNVSWFIYFYRCSTCFRRFLRPSSGAQNCTYSFTYFQPILLLAASVDEMEFWEMRWNEFHLINYSS